jgi:hypothetical protein
MFNGPSPIDYWVQHAQREVFGTYGDRVLVKPKSLLKFGQNLDVDDPGIETVWLRGGIETYATGNTIDKISSSDDSDNQEVVVEGHTLSGSDLTFVVQTVTLDGQTETSLDTPLYRATRMYNNGATDFAGTVYIYEDDAVTNGVPQTEAKIHLQTTGTNNQSLKAATSLSSQDYAFITGIYATVNKRTTASADFFLQVREFGKVFRTRFSSSAHSQGPRLQFDFRPFIIVPPNSDIRITCEASVDNTSVEAGFNSLLALKQS